MNHRQQEARTLLAHCEQEQLHLSGAIQSHGALIIVDAGGVATHVSANSRDVLGLEPGSLLGEPIDPELASLGDTTGGDARTRVVMQDIDWPAPDVRGARRLDLVLSRGAGSQLLLEFTPHRSFERRHEASAARLGSKDFGDQQVIDAARQQLVDDIGRATESKRVVYYAFRQDGDGEVLSEFRQGSEFGSYLGLRFPASDVPQIARQLYIGHRWRLIGDAHADPVPVLAGTPQDVPDLSASVLRSVSPVHRAYLDNMGVRASTSFPLVIAGRLRALVTAHHDHAWHGNPALLDALAAKVHGFAVALGGAEASQRLRMMDHNETAVSTAREVVQRHGELRSAWAELGPWLCGQFRCDGAMLVLPGSVTGHGDTLDPDAVSAVRDWTRREHAPLYATEAMHRDVPEIGLTHAAGLLVIPLGADPHASARIILLRREQLEHVAWGGNPDKPALRVDGALGVSPRTSFERWVETRRGHSEAWSGAERMLALNLRTMLMRERAH